MSETNMDGAQGKTFTQEEVNRIVQERLAKDREKSRKEQDAAFADREKTLREKELRFSAMEKLNKKGLSTTLVDAINCADDESIDKSIELLMQTYNRQSQAQNSYHPQNGEDSAPDALRSAMGLQ